MHQAEHKVVVPEQYLLLVDAQIFFETCCFVIGQRLNCQAGLPSLKRQAAPVG
jgi:hypothetical protein